MNVLYDIANIIYDFSAIALMLLPHLIILLGVPLLLYAPISRFLHTVDGKNMALTIIFYRRLLSRINKNKKLDEDFKNSSFYKEVMAWAFYNSKYKYFTFKSIRNLKNNLNFLKASSELYGKLQCEEYNFNNLLQFTMIQKFNNKSELIEFLEDIYNSHETINSLRDKFMEVFFKTDEIIIYNILTYRNKSNGNNFKSNIDGAFKYIELIEDKDAFSSNFPKIHKNILKILNKVHEEDSMPFEWLYELNYKNNG